MTARSPARIGLALAGGGPLGAIYEIGALCALADSLPGLDLTDCHAYVGVSAGGFIAAGLANGMRPHELCASFIENRGAQGDVLDPATLLRPAWGEYAKRLAGLPVLAAQAGWRYAFERRSLASVFERLGRALPTGLFSNDPIEAELRRIFSAPGRSNDFRQLRRKLVLVATDLDSGEAAPFGQPGWDQVPISRAVQASAALPGLFPPVRIGERHYVDGALKKTLHASVLLDEGLDLLLCLNPLVPFEATRDGRIPRLVDGGLPVVLSQTFRSLIHSRLEIGMKGYELSHPQTEIVLLEPDAGDAQLFLANSFSYSQRRTLVEHAYQQTRHMLRGHALGARLARHGLRLDRASLADPARTLVDRRRAPRRTPAAMRRLDASLDQLQALLARAHG